MSDTAIIWAPIEPEKQFYKKAWDTYFKPRNRKKRAVKKSLLLRLKRMCVVNEKAAKIRRDRIARQEARRKEKNVICS